MTMPHLMNCSHSEDGWCLDCVKKLHDEKEAIESNPAPEPRFQHAAEELRYVADLLDLLNKTKGGNIGIDGELEVFWVDRVMGVIALEDASDLSSWVYFPSANVNFEMSPESASG
jgi:hypothetical protein